MTQKINVIPAPGLLVLDETTGQPFSSLISRPQGTRVVLTSYVHKRLACGDLLEAPAPPEVSASGDGGPSKAAGPSETSSVAESSSPPPSGDSESSSSASDSPSEESDAAPARKPSKKDK